MKSREHLYDELLVLKCQAGDASAFEELVDRWQERLWRHAWRLVGDEEAAWDVLQEAWLGMSRSIRRLANAAAFRTWAYQIVSHKSRDWIRKQQRKRSEEQDWLEHRDQERREVLEENARLADLRAALAQLPGNDKAILSLRYEEGFDTEEIAAILGIPAGTVKSRLYHARRHLKERVEEKDHE